MSNWCARQLTAVAGGVLAIAVSLVLPCGALASRTAAPVMYSYSCSAASPCVVVAERPPGAGATSNSSILLRAAPLAPLTQTSFTWSGATPSGSPGATNWSLASNWTGGVAPSGAVGTLTFPILTNAACTASPPTDACYQSNNDTTGATAVSANAISIDDGASYLISGNGIMLGAGGLTATTASTTFASPPQLELPIALGANQTWTIDGNNEDDQLGVNTVSGASDALTINLNHETFLSARDIEVGPVTITGSTTTGPTSYVALSGAKLNGTNGNSVSLTGTGAGIFVPGNSTIGALNASAGTTWIGDGDATGAILSVDGGATLTGTTTLHLNVVSAGTTAGTDYSQVSASGSVSIGGTLSLAGQASGGGCPVLHVGDVDTLVKTTGALTGTFSGIPDGTTVAVTCSLGVEPTVRINYTGNSVTATVLTAGGNATPTVKSVTPDAGPTAGGNTVVIKGTNYAPGATVQFGATASSSVTFVSASELKAVAPAESSGVVNVTVTSGGSTSATSNNDLYAYGPPSITSFTPTSGITGSKVTINGTNFVPRAKVKFGTLAAKFSFVSPTQLKATVPNGAVPAPISVTTNAGMATSTTNYTPTFSITGFNPTSGPVGTKVTINGVGFTTTSTVKFHGTAASSVTFVSANELQATVPAGATSGAITVTNTAPPAGTVSSAGSFTVT